MQEAVFATLFVINHELHRNLRLIWPVGMGRGGAVSAHVACIAVHFLLSLLLPIMARPVQYMLKSFSA